MTSITHNSLSRSTYEAPSSSSGLSGTTMRRVCGSSSSSAMLSLAVLAIACSSLVVSVPAPQAQSTISQHVGVPVIVKSSPKAILLSTSPRT